MQKSIKALLLFLIGTFIYAQDKPNYGDLDSHNYFVEQLDNAKDENFQRIIERYNTHILQNPKDIIARVELCRFIGNSYYDEYEDYNLKYDETIACIDALHEQYPTHPQVLIYKAENLYGEEKLQVLEEAFDLIKKHIDNWSDIEKASINEMLGNYYRYEENNSPALKYFIAAQNYNSDLDLSIPISELYLDREDEESAKDILLNNLEKDTTLWKLNSKARVLLKLGETNKALEIFNTVQEKDSSYVNGSEMAKAMINLEEYNLARGFLVKDTVGEWNKISNLRALFEHDLKYSNAEIALTTYRSLQENNGYDDLLGIKRMRIFFKDPLLGWKASEFFHLMLNFLVLLILLMLPYLWILPIPYIGDWIRKRNKGKQISKMNLGWGLKHFWIISFLYLAIQFILTLFFYYEDTIDGFFDVASTYGEEIETDADLANGVLAFTGLMALGTLAILRKVNIRRILTSNMGIGKTVGLSIGFVFFNALILRVLKIFVDFDDTELANLILNPKVEIAATLRTYGFFVAFLCVAVVGPIYEEIIFRGTVLGSVEKHLGFIGANIFQAALFALIHFDLNLFIYYFIFGIVTGMYVKKTGGLRTGIILHAVNNFLVLLAISVTT